jgi:hypothetical protein
MKALGGCFSPASSPIHKEEKITKSIEKHPWAGGVAQAIEHLPSKHKALN